MVIDAIATARAAGACGQVMVRADSGYYRRDLIAAAVTAKAWFSVTVRMNSSVRQAIMAIPDTSWTTIRYPRAIWEPEDQRWISEAEVAEIGFTAFISHPKKRQIPCRLVVRRGATAQSRGEEGTGRAVHDVASPRVRYQLHPHRDRRGRDPP